MRHTIELTDEEYYDEVIRSQLKLILERCREIAEPKKTEETTESPWLPLQDELTHAAVLPLTRTVRDKHGIETLRGIISKFAANYSSIPPEKLAEFVAELKRLA